MIDRSVAAPPATVGLAIAEEELARLYPAYLRLDPTGDIADAGPSMLDRSGGALIGEPFFARFAVERPEEVFDIASLRRINSSLELRMLCSGPMRLQGVALARSDCTWLLIAHGLDFDVKNAPMISDRDLWSARGAGDVPRVAQSRQDLLEEACARTWDLERQRDAAVAANIAKSAFLAAMSHEIRTPMNGVLGIATLLADTNLTGQQREMLNVMAASGRLLMETLNDVLDISKIESGKMDVERTSFDLDSLFASVRQMFAPMADAKGLGFEFMLDAADPWRLGDPVRIRQVLVNLISNSLKFTASGKICVEGLVRDLPDGPILRVSVRDTGIGISSDALSRLFQPFVQADESTARRFGGTGLGLAISKLLCDQMCGQISAESRLGRGSTFTIELPLPKAQARHVESAPPDERVRLGQVSPHVLVVEDNATNRFVLTLFLDKLSITHDVVQNGAEALLAWERRDYDLVLMDIEMPVLDGLETTRELRRREQLYSRLRTPIVALSADAMVESNLRARQVGMDDFVTKPIELKRLEETIARHAVARDGDSAASPAKTQRGSISI